MALYGVGKTKVLLRLNQNGSWYETVCRDITITREPNVASRLTTSIRRDEITAEVGDILMLTLDDQHNQFMGVITDTVKDGIWCDVTAYDQIYYLNKSKGYMAYEEKTASQLLIEITKQQGLKMVDPPHVMDTGYVIPYRVEDGVSYLDMITTALDLTAKNTGERFFLWDDCGNLCLHNEEWLKDNPNIIISFGFIEDYSYTESMEDMYTRVNVVSEVNDADNESGKRTVYTADDEAQQKRYGLMEWQEVLGERENGDFKAQSILKAKNFVTHKLSVSGCQGDITVRGGTPVYVDFFSRDNGEYIRGWFRTESVTHRIKGGHHTMDLDMTIIDMYDDWGTREME